MSSGPPPSSVGGYPPPSVMQQLQSQRSYPGNSGGGPPQYPGSRSMSGGPPPPMSPGRPGMMPPQMGNGMRGMPPPPSSVGMPGTPPRGVMPAGGPMAIGNMGGAPRSMSAPGYGSVGVSRAGAGGAMSGMPPAHSHQGYPPSSDFMSSSLMGGGAKHGKGDDLDISQFPALGRQSGSSGGPPVSSYSAVGGMKKMDGSRGRDRDAFSMMQDDFPALPGAKPPKSPDQSPMFMSGAPGQLSPGPQSGQAPRSRQVVPPSPGFLAVGGKPSPHFGGMGGVGGVTGSGGSYPANHPGLLSPQRSTEGEGGLAAAAAGAASQQLLAAQQASQEQAAAQAQSRGGPPPSAAAGELSEKDRFGMMGLLRVIRMPDPDYKTLVLGTDLTTLGLNLNTPDVLFPSFASAWAEGPVRPKDPPFQLPACYNVRTQLPSVAQRIYQFSDETLFYAFYSMPCDIVQQTAANMLYQRDWRFHKEQEIWITRAPGTEPTQKTNTYERGTYIVFDVNTWKPTTKELILQYDQLEERKI